MTQTPIVMNKVNHVVNKIKKVSNCSADVWISTNDSLIATKFEHLIDESDEVMYAFEIVVDRQVNPYIKNQIAYLNKWLTKYNTKHKTKFTCLGIEVEGA
jgi:DUF438 domain-containing protein